MSKDTYSMEARCENCKSTWVVAIPKGTPVIIYEKTIVCGNCGCGEIFIRAEMRFR